LNASTEDLGNYSDGPSTPYNQSIVAEETTQRSRNVDLDQFTEKLKRELESNKKKLEESFKGISLLDNSKSYESSKPQGILKNTQTTNESFLNESFSSPAQKKMQLEELQQAVKKDLNASLTILEAEEKKYQSKRPTSRGSSRTEPGKFWTVEPDIDTRLARSVVGTSARKGSKRVEFSDSPLRDDLGMISPSVRVRTEPSSSDEKKVFQNSLEEFKSRLLEQKERKEDISRIKQTIDSQLSSSSTTPSRNSNILHLEKSKFQLEKDLEESRRKISEIKKRDSEKRFT
jgi:uncharacterized protein YeeX (DUF496 family)